MHTGATGGPITSLQLSQAVAILNGRIRSSGMSAHELWTQRDQVSGEQLPLNDRELIIKQHQQRLSNHPSSEKSKAGNKPPHPAPNAKVGTLVYLYSDRDKTQARQRYMVTEVKENGYKIRKFSATLFSKQVYDVMPNEIYVVPEYYKEPLPEVSDDSSEEEYDDDGVSGNKPTRYSYNPHNSAKSDSEAVSDEIASSSDSQSGSDEEIRVPGDNDNPQTIDQPVPPVELTTPTDKRRSVGISGRLRKRKQINYAEEPEDT